MPIHFTPEELAGRRQKVIDALVESDLHGLLMFRQESMYYLTGYDTFGYVFFQCLYLGVDGTLSLVTRMPDKRPALYTSMIEDIRTWEDAPDADPARTDLKPVLDEHGCKGKRLAVEYEAYGLTGRNAKRLDAALDGFCTLEDASELVSRLRLVKSPAEIEYVRRAAVLADDVLDEAFALARPGAFEGDILAAMQAAVFRGDGDYPGNEFIIGSGPACMIGRYHAGRRRLSDDDILCVEFAGVFRHYHACLWRTIKIGADSPKHRELWRLGVDSLFACEEALKPGQPLADVFAAYLDVMTKGGYGHTRYHSAGYSVGTTFSPNWMDWPLLYRDNPVVVEPGMVFFLHPGVRDDDLHLAAVPGETVLVTETGAERLSRHDFEYPYRP